MHKQKYPNSFENRKNREYTLYALTLDVAVLIGKLSVAKDEEYNQLAIINGKLIDRLNILLAIHNETLKLKGITKDEPRKLGRPRKRNTLDESAD